MAPTVELLRCMGPVQGAPIPSLSSRGPPTQFFWRARPTARSLSSQCRGEAAAPLRKIKAVDQNISRFRVVFFSENGRLTSALIRGDPKPRRAHLDSVCLKLIACMAGTMTTFILNALPALSAVDIDAIVTHPVAVEDFRSAPSIERILAEQLAARFRAMSDQELIQMIHQLLQAPPLHSQTECLSPSPPSQPAGTSPSTLPLNKSLPPNEPTEGPQSFLPPLTPPSAPPTASPPPFATAQPDGSQNTPQDPAPSGLATDTAADVAKRATAGAGWPSPSDAFSGSEDSDPDITASLWQAWAQRQESAAGPTPTPTPSLQGLDALVAGRSDWQIKAVQGAKGLALALAVTLGSLVVRFISDALPSSWKAAISFDPLAPSADKWDRVAEPGAGEGREERRGSGGETGQQRTGVATWLQSVGRTGEQEKGVGEGRPIVPVGGGGDSSIRRNGRRKKEMGDGMEEDLWWKAPPSMPGQQVSGADVSDAYVAKPVADSLTAGVPAADWEPQHPGRAGGPAPSQPPTPKETLKEALEDSGFGPRHRHGGRQAEYPWQREGVADVEGEGGGHNVGNGFRVSGKKSMVVDVRSGNGAVSHMVVKGPGLVNAKFDEDFWRERGGHGGGAGAQGSFERRLGRRGVKAEAFVLEEEENKLFVQRGHRNGWGRAEVADLWGGGEEMVGNKEGFVRRGVRLAGGGEGNGSLATPSTTSRDVVVSELNRSLKRVVREGGRPDYWEVMQPRRSDSGAVSNSKVDNCGGGGSWKEIAMVNEGDRMGNGERRARGGAEDRGRGVLGSRLDWFIHRGVVWSRSKHGVFIERQRQV